MSDSRGGGQKMAMPVRIQAATSRLMWFHMLSKDLLRSELEVTVSYCGKELVNVMMLFGRLIRTAEK